MSKDVIIACDFNSKADLMTFLDKFENEDRKPFLKVGMELFYAEGPAIVKEIKARGHKIFLDLKLHDIPNTVKKAMAVLSALDVDICNLHAAGTAAMMEAALEGLTRADGTRPLLIAVTQLTSTSEERMQKDLLIDRPLDEVVMHYAKKCEGCRSGRRCLLPFGGRQGKSSLRRCLPYRNPRRTLCRWRDWRSGACDDTCKGKRAWL